MGSQTLEVFNAIKTMKKIPRDPKNIHDPVKWEFYI
jgi:hypothetical protein